MTLQYLCMNEQTENLCACNISANRAAGVLLYACDHGGMTAHAEGACARELGAQGLSFDKVRSEGKLGHSSHDHVQIVVLRYATPWRQCSATDSVMFESLQICTCTGQGHMLDCCEQGAGFSGFGGKAHMSQYLLL